VLLGHAYVRALDALLEVIPKAFEAIHVMNAANVFIVLMID